MLVTNLREFLLLGIDGLGRPATLERYALAPNEASFGRLPTIPRLTEQHRVSVSWVPQAVLLSGATLALPQDLAWFLARRA